MTRVRERQRHPAERVVRAGKVQRQEEEKENVHPADTETLLLASESRVGDTTDTGEAGTGGLLGTIPSVEQAPRVEVAEGLDDDPLVIDEHGGSGLREDDASRDKQKKRKDVSCLRHDGCVA